MTQHPSTGPEHPSYEHGLRPVRTEAAFRVGEAERATACDALADHFAAGRLDPAELEDRLTRAMAARSHSDLQVLFLDLRPRRTVPAAAAVEPGVEPAGTSDARTVVPFLTSLLILCLLLAGGMLLLLGAYNAGLFAAALVGGVATAVAGGCVHAIGHATLRRR